METKIPGIKAEHVIVTDACREKGNAVAFTEVIRLLTRKWDKMANDVNGVWPPGKGVKFHFVLTVEYDQDSTERR